MSNPSDETTPDGLPFDVSALFGASGPARPEPTADVRQGAADLNTLYRAFVEAGFSEEQSFRMLLAMIGRVVG